MKIESLPAGVQHSVIEARQTIWVTAIVAGALLLGSVIIFLAESYLPYLATRHAIDNGYTQVRDVGVPGLRWVPPAFHPKAAPKVDSDDRSVPLEQSPGDKTV